MSGMHHRRRDCRLCGGGDFHAKLGLSPTPVGGDFLTSAELGREQPLFPLDLFQCASCGHVQLLDVIDPDFLFRNCDYFSGKTGIVSHFEKLAAKVVQEAGLSRGDFVVDIGSNDGAFLGFFKSAGMRVLGVDPALQIAQYANDAGIETLVDMFTAEISKRVREEYGPADVVTANNVFAHTDDMEGMARSVRQLLEPEGLFVFEVSYLLDVVDKLLLGAIFHEHLCYHAVRPLRDFLNRCGLELIGIERVPIQGGSLVCTAQVLGGSRPVGASVGELIALEERRGVYNADYLDSFGKRLRAIREEVGGLLSRVTADRFSVAGFGAARGGALYVYEYGLGDAITYIVDDDPAKQGKFSPGYNIPVYSSSVLVTERPDYLVILAWIHSKRIIEKNSSYLASGGKFVSFYPSYEVVSGNEVSS